MKTVLYVNKLFPNVRYLSLRSSNPHDFLKALTLALAVRSYPLVMPSEM